MNAVGPWWLWCLWNVCQRKSRSFLADWRLRANESPTSSVISRPHRTPVRRMKRSLTAWRLFYVLILAVNYEWVECCEITAKLREPYESYLFLLDIVQKYLHLLLAYLFISCMPFVLILSVQYELNSFLSALLKLQKLHRKMCGFIIFCFQWYIQ